MGKKGEGQGKKCVMKYVANKLQAKMDWGFFSCKIRTLVGTPDVRYHRGSRRNTPAQLTKSHAGQEKIPDFTIVPPVPSMMPGR